MVMKKTKTILLFIKIIFLALIIFSCATSSRAFLEMDFAVLHHDFYSAIHMIVSAQSGNRVIYRENNAISLFMDKGLLEYYAGNYAASSLDLQNAERLIEEAYTRSISQSFLTYIANDNAKDYPGEDFEDIYLNVFNALNYYNTGNIDGALVEIRKLTIPNGKLDMLSRKYEYIDPSTGANLSAMAQRETGISQLPEVKSVNFSNSALARYIGALLYQGAGDPDAARIEFDQVYRAFNTNNNIYRTAVPPAVEQARNIPSGQARLNIISFTGLSPIKEEAHIIHTLPFQHSLLRSASFKLPVLVRRPNIITRIEVAVDGKGSFDLELLEDMSAIMEETFNARFSNILLKTYIRTIIKYSVADLIAAETARNVGEMAGFLSALAAKTALEASEAADIRMSRYLPDKAYIGGINLDPGIYSVTISYYSGNRVISQERHTDIMVNNNRLNLLQSVNLR